jgi:hypothetical protein
VAIKKLAMNKYTLTNTNHAGFYEILKSLDPMRKWVFTWQEYKLQRSLSQNDWARKYARDFGKHFGYDADFAYDMLMYKCNPIFKTDIEGNEIRLGGSFSKLNTADAAEVQERMLSYGLNNGFYWDS